MSSQTLADSVAELKQALSLVKLVIGGASLTPHVGLDLPVVDMAALARKTEPTLARMYLMQLRSRLRAAFDSLHHMAAYIREENQDPPVRNKLPVDQFLMTYADVYVELLPASEFSSYRELYVRMSEEGCYLKLGEINNY